MDVLQRISISESHVAAAEKQVARQSKIVALLETEGLSAQAAREHLHALEDSLASHRTHRDVAMAALIARTFN